VVGYLADYVPNSDRRSARHTTHQHSIILLTKPADMNSRSFNVRTDGPELTELGSRRWSPAKIESPGATDLLDWLANELVLARALLSNHGALLVRGMRATPDTFAAATAALSGGALAEYLNRSTPRGHVLPDLLGEVAELGVTVGVLLAFDDLGVALQAETHAPQPAVVTNRHPAVDALHSPRCRSPNRDGRHAPGWAAEHPRAGHAGRSNVCGTFNHYDGGTRGARG
jgi:hypothetical protein